MKKETSKLILLVDFTIAILLAVAVTLGAFLEKDMSQVAAIAIGWDAQLATAVGFYYWKAKNENRSKGTAKLIQQLAETHGIEAAARFAEIIYRD